MLCKHPTLPPRPSGLLKTTTSRLPWHPVLFFLNHGSISRCSILYRDYIGPARGRCPPHKVQALVAMWSGGRPRRRGPTRTTVWAAIVSGLPLDNLPASEVLSDGQSVAVNLPILVQRAGCPRGLPMGRTHAACPRVVYRPPNARGQIPALSVGQPEPVPATELVAWSEYQSWVGSTHFNRPPLWTASRCAAWSSSPRSE